MPRDYLTVADVLGMHTALVQRYGGALGVRDPGALEAALFRPQTGYYDDLVAEAAALMESLAVNHPFIDGNKRIAFAAADVFLRINGWRLQRPAMQISAEMTAMLESGTFDIAHIVPWLRGFATAAYVDAVLAGEIVKEDLEKDDEEEAEKAAAESGGTQED